MEELSRATGAKPTLENAQEPTSVARAAPLILHDNARPHIADVVTKKNFVITGGKYYSCSLQSRHESTRLRLIPKVKRT